ncbi:MAG: hypothetical protein IKV94_00750 [Clostridia bacterium]|nr:hypothetical protein [Clostridia bacterium]
MKRIRDYSISRVLEEVTKKKIEYMLEEDLVRIDRLVIKNIDEGKISKFKDLEDLKVFEKLGENLEIEFEGFDFTDVTLKFFRSVRKIALRRCRIDNFKIQVAGQYEGYELILEKVLVDSGILVNEQAPQTRELVVIGKPTVELTREYTVEEIAEEMKKREPAYSIVPDADKANLLKKHGFLSIYPQRINITGIDKLQLLKKISLTYMEINTINFSEIKKYSKNIRILDEIRCIRCKFNEAPILYKQPVKRLVIDECIMERKSLLPNFVKVNAIEVINTKGMEIPKLNEPKLLKGIKLVNSEANLKGITKLKKLESVIVLEQELPEVKFAKKLKKLKYLVVSEGKLQNKDVISKLKKLEFVEVKEDDKTAKYNELFV